MLDADRHPELVAPDLLGWSLVCRGTAVVLVELEAYHQDEPAAHSFGGRPTPRTEALFGPAGTLYVYFTYGMHWCANLVTGPAGSGEAVLFRAGVPVAGEALMRERRAAPRGGDPARFRAAEVAGGPGRLTQALGMRPEDNGATLLLPDGTAPATLAAALEITPVGSEHGPVLVRDSAAAERAGFSIPLRTSDVLVGPRIGISKAVELPWRFGVRGSKYLSKPF